MNETTRPAKHPLLAERDYEWRESSAGGGANWAMSPPDSHGDAEWVRGWLHLSPSGNAIIQIRRTKRRLNALMTRSCCRNLGPVWVGLDAAMTDAETLLARVLAGEDLMEMENTNANES